MNDYQDAPQNYLMAELLNFNSVDYDSVGDLIHKLSCQMVAFMKSYLSDDDVINVLQYYGFQLATAIHRQMEEHVEYDTVEYHATIGKGFVTPQEYPLNCDKDESIRNFREEVDEKRYIRSIIFSGFSKCIYNNQKFDSDSERLLSVLLEGDSSVLKWFKPKLGDFKIHYRIGVEEHQYNPDFVVETSTCKYICEIKRSDQAELDKVQAKAQAAAQWCVYANEHAKQYDCKMWKYLLVPHDEIRMNSTLDFLAEKFGK